MATYKISWRSAALRDLKRLDRQVASRIVSAVEALVKDPLPRGVRKLSLGENTYRLRVGDYRVIYSVLERQLVVEIVHVRHRRDVYQHH